MNPSNLSSSVMIAPAIRDIPGQGHGHGRGSCAKDLAGSPQQRIGDFKLKSLAGYVRPKGPDRVSHTNDPGANDFSQHALAMVEHQLTQTGANGIHFGAR